MSDSLLVFGSRPVFMHAHPDDESISTGGTIALLARRGAQVTILTGTRGERGEVVPGDLHELEGTAALGPHRVGELASALRELGAPAHAFLGTAPARARDRAEREYSDSGMRWGADGFAEAAEDASPTSLSLAALDEVVDDVLAAATAGRPTAIVSYDALGGYGHPDHVRMHAAGVEAARRLGVAFFAIVEPRVAGTDDDHDDELIEVDLLRFDGLAAKTRAMAAHRTQLTVENGSFVLSGGQRHPIGAVERFRRLF
ncbi:PIG-L family deacetylase [Herbiconiux ginsengi]|uniref:N-acetylglucosaminyl deacetylase, LmbE family n=1 Tax=Herbiconiux ginsengi TaxID=381665 RepID=A0A1H3M786_9MICO|nr:PIG-L family deacetylase [Herbiconiux ginsengi]SDY72590.1 N-acetylglucosaminyl deacetylase, LmbE family [Herbiconiux ginsengi]